MVKTGLSCSPSDVSCWILSIRPFSVLYNMSELNWVSQWSCQEKVLTKSMAECSPTVTILTNNRIFGVKVNEFLHITLTAANIYSTCYSVPPLLPPPLVPVCLVLALWPPGTRCCALLWQREVEFGLEIVLSSCSMEHRSAMRASRSTVSPWFNASAEWRDKARTCRQMDKKNSLF